MSEDEGLDRRTLIRLLVVLGIGIPILIEGITFLGLLGHSLGGDDGATGTPTPAATGVGIGDDLLPGTPHGEAVTTASLAQADDHWEFVLTVQVTPNGTGGYELSLGAVRTTDGTVVPGDATTGRIEAGESRPVTARYSLPEGERPRSIAVTAVEYDGEGERVTNETVRLERVPLSG